MGRLLKSLIILLFIVALLVETDAGKKKKKRRGRRFWKRWYHEFVYLPEDLESKTIEVHFKKKIRVFPSGCPATWCNGWRYYFTTCCSQYTFEVRDVTETVCQDGWWGKDPGGKDCNLPKCTGQPCPQGETCIAPNTCGPIILCEEDCKNGGTCTGLETCTCTSDYTGPYCKTPVDPAAPAPPAPPGNVDCSREQPCLNSGTCGSDGKCSCQPGFTGTNCQTLDAEGI